MEDSVPAGSAVPIPVRTKPIPRWVAIIEIVAVSGVPTGLLAATILLLGTNIVPFTETGYTLEFIGTATLLDTAFLALLIRVFLELSGEDSRTVFVGIRPVWGEIWRGLALVPVVFGAVTVLALGLRTVAPWLHTVKDNPLDQFMHNPLDAAIFVVVVVLGGGAREELQRAFVLHRFDQALGGMRLGLIITSVIFGLLHFNMQGADVAIATGLLGLFWGLLYMRRRSAVMSITNHAGFDALQIVLGTLAHTLGL